MHKFDLKECFWERDGYYTRVINFPQNYRNVIRASRRGRATGATQWPPPAMRHWWWIIGLCSSQLWIRNTQHTLMCQTICHTLHTSKTGWFSVLSSSVMRYLHSTVYKREHWTDSKCFGEILQHIYYTESMTSVLYSFWQADDHQMAEAHGNTAAEHQYDGDVVLTGRDADHPHTHNSRYPHQTVGLYQSYTHHTQRPSTVRFCNPAGGLYVGPPTATSNMLYNIQISDYCRINQFTWTTHTDADTGMREEYADRSDASHSPVTERILAEASEYNTRELLFSPSTTMKSHPAYYKRVRIVREILQ